MNTRREEGKKGQREESGVEGWMWINIAANKKKSVISSELQKSERTTEASSFHLCSCRGRTGGKEGEKED